MQKFCPVVALFARYLGQNEPYRTATQPGPVLHAPNISEALHTETQSISSKTLEEMEREYIITALGKTRWKIEGPHGAAVMLGLHPSTLRTRMAKLRIQKPQRGFV